MDYRRFGDKLVVRLDKGEEVCAKLLELAEKENIRLASVSGIGASGDVTLGVFNPRIREYKSVRYEGDYEIASLTGNLSRQDGKPYLHLHAVIGDPTDKFEWHHIPSGVTYSGHLNAAVVSATCEMVITVINGYVDRRFDENIGLNLFKF